MKKVLISIIITAIVVCFTIVTILLINSNNSNNSNNNSETNKKTKLVYVNGYSMEPSLKDGEIVRYKIDSDINRFDIIVFKDKNNNVLIKRVYALPHETIKVNNEKIYINGEEIKDIYGKGKFGIDFEYTVEADSYYVMGDNREISLDSRYFGAVKKEKINGVVLGDSNE